MKGRVVHVPRLRVVDAPSSGNVVHAIIHRALKTAVRDPLLVTNPAAVETERPRASKDHGEGARQHCWSADEARAVLSAAKETSPQDAGTVTIDRQLAPDFAPTKTGKPRVIVLNAKPSRGGRLSPAQRDAMITRRKE